MPMGSTRVAWPPTAPTRGAIAIASGWCGPGDIVRDHEVDGGPYRHRTLVPTWLLGRPTTLEAAAAPHYAHLAQAYRFPGWESRSDVPAWLKRTALVVTLHGMHFTGYVFNDFARMREILKWIATQIPADRVGAFLPCRDGRYDWDYATARVP